MPSSDTYFKEGNPGNGGRPIGARSKLSKIFIDALVQTFDEKVAESGKEAGVESLRELRDKQPAQYNNVIAKLMPKLLELSGPDGDEIKLSGRVTFVGKDKDA